MPAIFDRGTGDRIRRLASVTTQYVTSMPASVQPAMVPAAPKSTSSGWAKTTRIRSTSSSLSTRPGYRRDLGIIDTWSISSCASRVPPRWRGASRRRLVTVEGRRSANALERIDAVNPKLNAFSAIYADEALAEAAQRTRALSNGKPRGPLHGVPIALKDGTPMKGRRTTLGSYAYEHWIPDDDAAIVVALQRAGAIVVGKTTLPEFAHSSFTESPLLGVTRNPWNLAHTPGGSSGGAARRGGERLRATRRGHRHGRFGAHPCRVVRTCGPQTESRSHPAGHPAVGVRQPRPPRSTRPDGRRCPTLPPRHAGARRSRYPIDRRAARSRRAGIG